LIDKETLRKLCEYPITRSLIGEIEPVKETARERADRRWRMEPKDETQSAIVEANP
jgi:hypothetical protein